MKGRAHVSSKPVAAADAVAQIHAAVRRIPPGKVATYGDVAAAAGLPGRARMVGRNLGPTVPWYRVIAAAGRIALPEGSAGRDEQCARLEAEGVAVINGRVDLQRYRWKRGSDAPLID